MITFMLSVFYFPHKNPTLLPLFIPEDPRYLNTLRRKYTRAEPQSRQNCAGGSGTFCSKAVSDLFGLEPESTLQSPGASLDSSQVQAHPHHPKVHSACQCARCLPPQTLADCSSSISISQAGGAERETSCCC